MTIEAAIKRSSRLAAQKSHSKSYYDDQDGSDSDQGPGSETSSPLRSSPAGQRRRAAGATTVVKGSASTSRPKKQRLYAEEADDSGTLFEALSSPGISIASCVSDWKGRLVQDRDAAIVELVNLVVRASGSIVKLSAQDLSSGKDDTNYSRGRLDTLLAETDHVAFDVPLLAKKKQFKDFQKNYDNFWRKWFLECFKDEGNTSSCNSRIVSEAGEYFKYLLEIVITFSHDGNRSIRYAASKAAYSCLHEAALLRKKFVFKNNFESEIVIKWFDRLKQGVFGNRYRDVNEHVRVESINIIGELAFLKLPSESIDVYLKYVVWFLDDADSNVRMACVNVLKKIVNRERSVEFEEFLDLHKDKIISQSLFDEDEKICRALSSGVVPLLISKYGLDEEAFALMAPLLCRPQADVNVIVSMIEVFIDISFSDADFTAIEPNEFFKKLAAWLGESCRSFIQRRDDSFGLQRNLEVSEFTTTLFIATHNVMSTLLEKDHWDARMQLVINNAHVSLYELLNEESSDLDQWQMNSISCMLFSVVKQQIDPSCMDSGHVMFSVNSIAGALNSEFYDSFIQASSQYLLSTLTRFKYMNNDASNSIELQTFINILNLTVFALVGCVQETETIDASQRWIGLREYHSFEEILAYLKDLIMDTNSVTACNCVSKILFGQWSIGDSSISLLANTSVARKTAMNALSQNLNNIIGKLQAREQELLNLNRFNAICQSATKEVSDHVEKTGFSFDKLVDEIILSIENGNDIIPKALTVWRILFQLYAYKLSADETGGENTHEMLLRITGLTKTVLQTAKNEMSYWILGNEGANFAKVLDNLKQLPIMEKIFDHNIDFVSLLSDSCFLLMSKNMNEEEMGIVIEALTSCDTFMIFLLDSVFSGVLHVADHPHLSIDSLGSSNVVDERDGAFIDILYGLDPNSNNTRISLHTVLKMSQWADTARNMFQALSRNTWAILRYDFANRDGIDSVASIASWIGRWNKWVDIYSELAVTEFFTTLAKLDSVTSIDVASQFLVSYYKKVLQSKYHVVGRVDPDSKMYSSDLKITGKSFKQVQHLISSSVGQGSSKVVYRASREFLLEFVIKQLNLKHHEMLQVDDADESFYKVFRENIIDQSMEIVEGVSGVNNGLKSILFRNDFEHLVELIRSELEAVDTMFDEDDFEHRPFIRCINAKANKSLLPRSEAEQGSAIKRNRELSLQFDDALNFNNSPTLKRVKRA